jgi:hypothetical protein
MRGLVRGSWKLGVASDIYPMKYDLSILRVAEPRAVNAKSERSHEGEEARTRCTDCEKIIIKA